MFARAFLQQSLLQRPLLQQSFLPKPLLRTALLQGVLLLGASVALLPDIGQVLAEEDPVVAIINDYVIKYSDINAQIAQMPLGDQVSIRSDPEKFAESLIQEEVLFQYVLGNGFADEESLRAEIKTTVVNHLIDKHVTQKLVISDEEIEKFYNENTSAIRGETVEVSQILTETREECEALQVRLANGESFAELATQYSQHERSAENGGVVGSLMNHEGPLGFEQHLFGLPHHEPTLFESEEGCHLVVITGQTTPPLPPLENVASGIEGLLLRQLEIEVLQELMERANQQVTVVRP